MASPPLSPNLPNVPGKGQPVSILIVDDDSDIREALTVFLQDAGYTVHEAPNGKPALRRLHASSDRMVVLVDLMMAGMDGQSLLEAVAAHEVLAARHAYILMTAGNRTLPLDFVLLLSQLDVPVLAKPFELDRLLGRSHRPPHDWPHDKGRRCGSLATPSVVRWQTLNFTVLMAAIVASNSWPLAALLSVVPCWPSRRSRSEDDLIPQGQAARLDGAVKVWLMLGSPLTCPLRPIWTARAPDWLGLLSDAAAGIVPSMQTSRRGTCHEWVSSRRS